MHMASEAVRRRAVIDHYASMQEYWISTVASRS